MYFAGTLCEINIDECESNPCLNSGTCVDDINSYKCECMPGYRGNRCQQDIDECDEWQPCENGATCRDAINNYWCDCAETGDILYGGKNCSKELTGCVGNTCINGATCNPLIKEGIDGNPDEHYFECHCASGFKGDDCEISTTTTFAGTAWGHYESEIKNISLRFRTTLLEGVLLVNRELPGGKEFVLGIAEAGQGVKAEVRREGVIQASKLVTLQQGESLVNGDWQQVNLLNFNKDLYSIADKMLWKCLFQTNKRL